MEAERPLPRGGKRAASALELRAARAAAERDVARALEAGGADGEDFLADGGGDKEARRAAKRARRDGGKGDKGLTAEQAEMRAIDAEAAAFAEGVVSAAAPARAAMLRAADLRAHGGGGGTLGNGTRLLGVVVAVGGDRDVTVALPHGLRGFAAAVDAAGAGAPPLAELFAPGDLVCAAVKSADASKGAKGGRRVALGLLPAFCNGAASGGAGGGGGALSRAAPPKGASLVGVVASEEDHGFRYVCSRAPCDPFRTSLRPSWAAGIRGRVDATRTRTHAHARVSVRTGRLASPPSADTRSLALPHTRSVDLGDRLLQGFLKRKAAPAGLRVGAPLRVTVARGAKKGARVVELAALAAAHGADEAERAAEEYAGVTLQALQPGDLVEATVKAVLPDGLHVGFMTYFSGTVDRFHVGEGEHRKGDTVTARVLCVWRAGARANPSARMSACVCARVCACDARVRVRDEQHSMLIPSWTREWPMRTNLNSKICSDARTAAVPSPAACGARAWPRADPRLAFAATPPRNCTHFRTLARRPRSLQVHRPAEEDSGADAA